MFAAGPLPLPQIAHKARDEQAQRARVYSGILKLSNSWREEAAKQLGKDRLSMMKQAMTSLGKLELLDEFDAESIIRTSLNMTNFVSSSKHSVLLICLQ